MLTFVATALLACALETPAKPTPQDVEFAAAQARFALDFYRSIEGGGEGEGGNLICSPFSVARALAMAREGAAGTTAEELDRALAFPPDLRARFAALAKLLEPRQLGRGDEQHGTYTLELATSLWGQEGLAFAPDFLRGLKEGYASELLRADFAKPDLARAEINEWTAKHTAGRIPEIIGERVLDADTRLVLIDTIRFLANWETPFKAESTRPAPFTPASGPALDVPTMHRTARLAYAETELAQVLELPYELGASSMLIVLPKQAGGLAAVTTKEDIASWTAKLEQRDVELALPKFRMEWSQELKPALRALGIQAAFDSKSADFSRILTRPEPLFVSHVLQRAFVAVDEKGTEAAAATAVVMSKGSRPPEPQTPVAFHADHPFLFLIRHRATGTVLFVGRVANPAA